MNVRATVSTLLLLSLLPTAASAQQWVRGRVIDDATERPITGAEVELLNETGEVSTSFLTDSTGSFALRVPRPGQYAVRARAFGYAPSAEQRMTLLTFDSLRVELRLSTEPVLLAPIDVEVDRPLTVPTHLIPYYERRQWYGRRGLGVGQFFDGEKLEMWRGIPVTSLLRGAAFVRLEPFGVGDYRFRGRTGRPMSACIDGKPPKISTARALESWGVIMSHVAAIEVYRGYAPGDVDCSIIIWMK